MFSDRLPSRTDPNALSRAVEARRVADRSVIDLTESNPTRASIPYPSGLLDGLADSLALRYAPEPAGLAVAREAVAADARRRGAAIDPRDIVLSSSTSEAYGWLFKLLCNPGEHVLVPQPSYPLFEHLTRLEGVRSAPYDLHYYGRWEIDFDSVAGAPADTRAVLVVTPNNPTGSYVSAAELERLVGICAERGWALVADEVFADYPLEAVAPVTDLTTRADVLSFSLGGASKSIGLPQVKLGWLVAGGPAPARAAAVEALSLIADTYLSVATPVQLAAPALLRQGAAVHDAIHQRIRHNLASARRIVERHPACDLLRVEGGWSAVIRVPSIRDDEQFVLGLLDREGILVHPGYFFDFARGTFVVVSLLPPEEIFADAVEKVFRYAGP